MNFKASKSRSSAWVVAVTSSLARQWIADHDGKVDAIGLEGLPAQIRLGASQRAHESGRLLAAIPQSTPVVDGSGVRSGLERWGVILADRAAAGHLQPETNFAGAGFEPRRAGSGSRPPHLCNPLCRSGGLFCAAGFSRFRPASDPRSGGRPNSGTVKKRPISPHLPSTWPAPGHLG